MSEDHNLMKFDVRRLTAVGWLLFAASTLFAFLCLAVTWIFYAEIFSPDMNPDGSYQMYPMIPFFAFMFGGLGSFFAAKVVLGLVGVVAVRPRESEYTINPAPHKKRSRKRRDDDDDD